LEWLGHVVRKNGERAVNQDGRRNTLIKVNGRRSGLEDYEFKKWRKRSSDEREWTSLVREAKAKIRGV
jgi:hypothetical protein